MACASIQPVEFIQRLSYMCFRLIIWDWINYQGTCPWRGLSLSLTQQLLIECSFSFCLHELPFSRMEQNGYSPLDPGTGGTDETLKI